MYDYLVVGAGLFGATFANLMKFCFDVCIFCVFLSNKF